MTNWFCSLNPPPHVWRNLILSLTRGLFYIGWREVCVVVEPLISYPIEFLLSSLSIARQKKFVDNEIWS